MCVENQEENKTSIVHEGMDNWGYICCAECDGILCYYPGHIYIDEDSGLEFYCPSCAKKEEHGIN